MNDYSNSKDSLGAATNGLPPARGRSTENGWRLPGLETRWPVFELALLLVVGALGWSAYHTYNVLNLSKREPDATQDTQDIQEILKLHSLMEVKERYATLADQLESGVADLRESLLVYLRDKDRGEIGRSHR